MESKLLKDSTSLQNDIESQIWSINDYLQLKKQYELSKEQKRKILTGLISPLNKYLLSYFTHWR